MKLFKKIFLLLPLITFLLSCGNNSSHSSSSLSNVISVNNDDIKALPDTNFVLEVENPLNEKIEYEQSSYELFGVTQISPNSFNITFKKEGNGNIKIKTNTSNEVNIDIEILDLKITNEDDYVEVGSSLQISLSHNVEADYSVDGDGASISKTGLLNVTKEGEFKVNVEYGLICLSKTFDSNQRINEISTLNRNNKYLKYLGRNVFINNTILMNNIGSGFEVSFYGTSLKAEFESMYRTFYGVTRISVLIDDEKDTNKNVIVLKSSLKTEYTLTDNLIEGFHTVKVLKRTEALSTYLTLHKVKTDGYFKIKKDESRLKIDSYGDSITAGYGNLRGTLSDTTSSEYQNGLQTYATYTAFALDADINVQARSGLGLYTAGNIDDSMQLNSLYNFVNYDGEYEWNMENYIPDLVFINIGTNDYWNGSVFNQNTFIKEYVSLIKKLSSIYGVDTSFILMSGLMEKDVINFLPNIKNEVSKAISNDIHIVEFDKCREGHPRFEEHLEASDKLVKYIKDNNLDVIHDHKEPEVNVNDPIDVVVNAELTFKSHDQIPMHVELFANGMSNEDTKLTRINDFEFRTELSVKEGDYEVSLYANNKSYSNHSKVLLKVRSNNNKITKWIDSFSSYPIDENEHQDTYGWYMGYHSFEASFFAPSSSSVSLINKTNWLAGMVLKTTPYSDNYSLEADISTASIDTNTYIGFVPYYLNDLNYIVVYLQFDSSLKCRGFGSTGIIDGNDIGFTDYSEFVGASIDLSNQHVKVSRNGLDLTISMGSKSVTKRFYTMNQKTKYIGLYSLAPNTINYSNIVIKEDTSYQSPKWVTSAASFAETVDVISDNEIYMSNSNWLAGFALRDCEYPDSYTISSRITATKDNYLIGDDVQIGLVPFYADNNNFVVVYLQWNDIGNIKSIGVTGKANGIDLSWNDIWGTFDNMPSSLTKGQVLSVTRNGSEFKVEFGGKVGFQYLNQFSDKTNYAVGLWCHNALVTYKDIVLTSSN